MDVRDLLESLNIEVAPEAHHHSRAGWLQIDCPWHAPGSRKYHLGVNLNYLYCNCWVCGRHPLTTTLAEASGQPVHTVKRVLGKVERSAQLPELENKRGRLVLPKGLGPLLPAHKRYLRRRGFNASDLTRIWDLQGIGIAARLAWRVFIPVFQYGRMVSWTTRGLNDQGRRYIAAKPEQEILGPTSWLYGEDYCRHAIIIHEGPADVWATGPGAAGLCGTALTRARINRIARYPIRVVCLDNESEAQRRAEELCDLLMPFEGRTYNIRLDSKDAGSASEREIKRLRKFLN